MQEGRKLGPDRYHEVRYEDFTAEPEKKMRELCEFLGLTFDDTLLRSSMPFLYTGEERGSRKNKTGTIVNTGHKWKAYFTANQVEAIEDVIGGLLDELGYGATVSHGDTDPSSMRLLYWQTTDTIHLFGLVRRKHGLLGGRVNLFRRARDWYQYRSILRY